MVTIETLSVVTNAVIQRAGKGKQSDTKTKVRKIHATLKKLVEKGRERLNHEFTD